MGMTSGKYISGVIPGFSLGDNILPGDVSYMIMNTVIVNRLGSKIEDPLEPH